MITVIIGTTSTTGIYWERRHRAYIDWDRASERQRQAYWDWRHNHSDAVLQINIR
jgi:hypothetical protein